MFALLDLQKMRADYERGMSMMGMCVRYNTDRQTVRYHATTKKWDDTKRNHKRPRGLKKKKQDFKTGIKSENKLKFSRAERYYKMGVKLSEIARLTDVNESTVHRWAGRYNWKRPKWYNPYKKR